MLLKEVSDKLLLVVMTAWGGIVASTWTYGSFQHLDKLWMAGSSRGTNQNSCDP